MTMNRLFIISMLTATLLLSLFILPHSVNLLRWNVFPFAVLLVLLYGQTSVSFISAVIGGFVFDLLSPYSFGTHIIALLTMLIVVRLFFRTTITNRSLIAFLALVAIGSLLYEATASMVSVFGHALQPFALATVFDSSWVSFLSISVARNIILAIVVNLVIQLTGRSYAVLVDREF